MCRVPYGKTLRTSYENFVAECPHCGTENVFNRVSDLGDRGSIALRTVTCLEPSCGRSFNINGDSVNQAYEMLLFDCHELLELKHYMNCILSVAQAFEVFFSLFLRVELIFKPFSRSADLDIDELNRLLALLAGRIKTHTFDKMRRIFLWHLAEGSAPADLCAAEARINTLPSSPSLPRDAVIDALGDTRLVQLVKGVRDSTIATARNQVVHKMAYRPSREEATSALNHGLDTLVPLGNLLDLKDDPNWYMRDVV